MLEIAVDAAAREIVMNVEDEVVCGKLGIELSVKS